jgi:hypothetical protein
MHCKLWILKDGSRGSSYVDEFFFGKKIYWTHTEQSKISKILIRATPGELIELY